MGLGRLCCPPPFPFVLHTQDSFFLHSLPPFLPPSLPTVLELVEFLAAAGDLEEGHAQHIAPTSPAPSIPQRTKRAAEKSRPAIVAVGGEGSKTRAAVCLVRVLLGLLACSSCCGAAEV